MAMTDQSGVMPFEVLADRILQRLDHLYGRRFVSAGVEMEIAPIAIDEVRRFYAEGFRVRDADGPYQSADDIEVSLLPCRHGNPTLRFWRRHTTPWWSVERPSVNP